jgi:cobalt-zinc-cadmium efflux system outer membrane protein
MFNVLYLALFLFQVIPVSNQDQGGFGMSDAVRLAEEQNPAIRQMQYLIEAQKENQLLSLNIQSPRVSYFSEDVGFNAFTERRWTVFQQVDFPLRSYFNFQGQKSTTSALEYRQEQNLLELRADVKEAYVNVLWAGRLLQIAEERKTLFGEMKSIATRRVEAGQSGDIDRLQAEIQYLESENAIRQAEVRFDQALMDFQQMLGIEQPSADAEMLLTDSLTYKVVDFEKSEMMEMLASYPLMRQRNELEAAALMRRKAAVSTYLPDLNLSYYRQNFGNEFDFYGFEIGVSIPIWFGVNQSRQVKRAGAELKNVEWRSYQINQELRTEAENAWNRYEAAGTNMEQFNSGILLQAESLIDKSRKGYEAGQFNLLTLLEAQRTYLRSLEMYYNNLRDYYASIFQIEKLIQKELVYD